MNGINWFPAEMEIKDVVLNDECRKVMNFDEIMELC